MSGPPGPRGPGPFPSACVVDASVLIKVVLAEEGSDLAKALLAGARIDTRVTPDLANLECASVLATSVRRGMLTQQEARASLLLLYRLPLTVHLAQAHATTALDLAMAHSISVYDATYAALAGALGLPFVTADGALVGKLRGSGVRALDLAAWRRP